MGLFDNRFASKNAAMSRASASFGTVVKHLCEDCAPRSKRFEDANVPAMDKKQVKNLMRSAKKGLL